MQAYQSPNDKEDSPVVKQIVLVLLGFAALVAASAVAINLIV